MKVGWKKRKRKILFSRLSLNRNIQKAERDFWQYEETHRQKKLREKTWTKKLREKSTKQKKREKNMDKKIERKVCKTRRREKKYDKSEKRKKKSK